VIACGGWAMTSGDAAVLTWGMVRRALHRQGIGRSMLRFRLESSRETNEPALLRFTPSNCAGISSREKASRLWMWCPTGSVEARPREHGTPAQDGRRTWRSSGRSAADGRPPLNAKSLCRRRGGATVVPIICMFFGIVIRMFYASTVSLTSTRSTRARWRRLPLTVSFSQGVSSPGPALRLIQEWATLHGAELEANWVSAKAGKPLERIARLSRGCDERDSDGRPGGIPR